MVAHFLRRSNGFGTGMHAWELCVVLVASVALFLLWGGPLWSAPAGATHVGRIVISYLAVIPLVALALRRRFTWMHLVSAVALVWSAKLVLTASVYAYLATGSASRYEPARNWEAPREAAPATAAQPILPASPPRDYALAIAHARYDQSRIVVAPRDHLVVANHDAALHTLSISRDGRIVRNLPLPAGSAPARIAVPPAPGEYRIGCENHASETAVMVVAPQISEDK